MGLLDKIKQITQPYDDEDEFDDEPEALVREPEPRTTRPRTAERSRSSSNPFGSSSSSSSAFSASGSSSSSAASSSNPFAEFETGSRSGSSSSAKTSSGAAAFRPNNVLNINTTAQLQVVLAKPERFESAAEIADHLREKRTVVMNLEQTNKDVARRLIDFLSGVAYAQDGKIKKVANSTYIITPYNVDLVGDLVDELENNGLYS